MLEDSIPDCAGSPTNLDSPEFVSTYDELPLWSAMAGLLMLKHLPLGHNLTVLDLGCGTGFPLLELAQRLGPTSTVYGIDPWMTALIRARHKGRVWSVENARVVRGNAEALPFRSDMFNLIVSNLGINNFARPATAVAECFRVAKPHGHLALTTNLRGQMAEFYDVFRSVLVQLKHHEALLALETHIQHRATKESLADLLEGSGFRITRYFEESHPLRFADGSTLLHHHFIQLGFLESWLQVVPKGDRPRVFSSLEANLNSLAINAGALALTIPLAYIEAEKPG